MALPGEQLREQNRLEQMGKHHNAHFGQPMQPRACLQHEEVSHPFQQHDEGTEETYAEMCKAVEEQNYDYIGAMLLKAEHMANGFERFGREVPGSYDPTRGA
ncbi:hypothetical protein ColTof4_07012 [Colletotrichum tofieldiae]|nr:hypothetical protein ColTof3_11956 [Colletotrichum tofieldiae]GKT74589.1 hypothetical protein ColTof4_07012 [Colletotrichum tofieldiae]